METMLSSHFVCRLTALLVLAGTLGMSGCGGGDDGPPPPETAPVTGKVSYNGEPVEGATVIFSVVGAPRSATGMTNAQGQYTLSTFGSGDGAILGENTVSIVKTEGGEVQSDAPGEEGQGPAVFGTDLDGKTPEEMEKNVAKPLLPVVPESDSTRSVVADKENVFDFDLKD
jgi:hypothetical protein